MIAFVPGQFCVAGLPDVWTALRRQQLEERRDHFSSR
jgi:hypothetical protein